MTIYNFQNHIKDLVNLFLECHLKFICHKTCFCLERRFSGWCCGRPSWSRAIT